MSGVDIVLVTGQVMPRTDIETPLLVDSLQRLGLGLGVAVVAWQDDLAWASVPLVVVRTPWDYFAQRDAFIAWARRVDAVTQLVNPVEILEWNSHKAYLLELAAAGVPILPTTLVTHGASGAERTAALRGFASHGEVVIKPAISVGAIGALRVKTDTAEAADHLAELALAGDALVQPLEPSVLTEGELSLIYFGGEYSHAVRKIPATGDFRVQERHGGDVVGHTPTAIQRDVAAAALAVAPCPTTYARVDLVRLDDPAVMELEIIEPELFLGRDPAAADRFAALLADLVRASTR